MGNKWLEWYWSIDGFKDEKHLHNKHKKCTCGGHSFNILDKRDKSRELYVRKREWTDDIGLWMTEGKLRRLKVMIKYNGRPKPKHQVFKTKNTMIC